MRYLTKDYADKMEGARRVITFFANVKKGEHVLVLTNPEKFSIAEFIAAATIEKGTATSILDYESPQFVNEEPPKIVMAALKAARSLGLG